MFDIASLAEIWPNHARHMSEASHLKANIADHHASAPGGCIMQMQKANKAIWWDMSQAFIFISHAAYGKWPRLQYFSDDTTCPHFCFSVRQFEQSRPDVYVNASQRSVLLHSVLPLPCRSWSLTALLLCWQTKTQDLEPWLKRRKTKAVKGPPVWTLTPPPGRDRKHNWLDPAVVFCPCFCFSPWLLQTSPFFSKPKTHAKHSWRADLTASSSFNYTWS